MDAQVETRLDIHGEGRLSKDVKPGLVSSRTRQQVRNLDKMAEDGTIPTREAPKYDLNGDLTWIIRSIEKSRAAAVEGIRSVEFLVKGGPCSASSRWHIQEGKEQQSWEDVTTLSLGSRWRVIDFYDKNPKAEGIQEVGPLHILLLSFWLCKPLVQDGLAPKLSSNRNLVPKLQGLSDSRNIMLICWLGSRHLEVTRSRIWQRRESQVTDGEASRCID
jgi:hypothetical protein